MSDLLLLKNTLRLKEMSLFYSHFKKQHFYLFIFCRSEYKILEMWTRESNRAVILSNVKIQTEIVPHTDT